MLKDQFVLLETLEEVLAHFSNMSQEVVLAGVPNTAIKNAATSEKESN